MAARSTSNAPVEIGHVLFLDIVGYSKLLTNEQRDRIAELTRIVRGTEAFRTGEAAGKLMMLPTGDGMVLAFFTSPDAPVRCAIEMSRALKSNASIPLRIGIHSGPVEQITDVSGRANVAGAGVNIAQRVMDCGDAGHILLSARAADDLAQLSDWKEKLHPLGEAEVKHGVRIEVVNLHDGEVGNAHVPQKIRAAVLRERKARRRKLLLIVGAAAAVAAATLLWFTVLHRTTPPPDKSIAVLPFENLSADEENAFLASGLQDEILTQLAKIGSLKVISRTSTQQYESRPKSVAKIAAELGVASILEGSVRKVGNSIRVNVQLIKAATDAHLWAETYDRQLIDMLKMQSEVAQLIASSLRATLTAAEKARLDEKATTNPEAYALYLKGTEVLRRPAVSAERMEEGIHYFEQAIALDPNFALAHARLGQLHTRLALFFDPSSLHKERGRTEPEEALRLQPHLSEAHIALGLYHGRLMLEFEEALREYDLAKQGAPNDLQILYGIGWVQMKSGQWKAAVESFERAVSLDPMNWNLYDNLGNAYSAIGMKAAAERAKRRSAELATGSAVDKFAEQMSWAWAYYELTGSTEKLKKANAGAADMDDSTGAVALNVHAVALLERDFDAAERAIVNSPATIFETFGGPRCTKNFLLGQVALARGDVPKARGFFAAELSFARSELAEAPDSAPRHVQLGVICAYLGQKEEAIAEGEHTVTLLPIEKDATDGPGIAGALAEIYGRVGETDKAVALLEKLLSTPAGMSQQALKDWPWDPLRNDPRFQKLIDGPPPKIIYK